MAVTVTKTPGSPPGSAQEYLATGLVDGANTIALPTPPAYGSFYPDNTWIPTRVRCFPYQAGAVGSLVTPDLSTIVNVNGQITFTVYAGGATNCILEVF